MNNSANISSKIFCVFIFYFSFMNIELSQQQQQQQKYTTEVPRKFYKYLLQIILKTVSTSEGFFFSIIGEGEFRFVATIYSKYIRFIIVEPSLDVHETKVKSSTSNDKYTALR